VVAGSLPLLGLGNQSEDLTHEDAVCDQMLQTPDFLEQEVVKCICCLNECFSSILLLAAKGILTHTSINVVESN
jgi:hypothetical protein